MQVQTRDSGVEAAVNLILDRERWSVDDPASSMDGSSGQAPVAVVRACDASWSSRVERQADVEEPASFVGFDGDGSAQFFQRADGRERRSADGLRHVQVR